jgi:hypothetical protein
MAPRWGSREQARLVAGRRLVRFRMFAPDGAVVLSSGRKPRVGCGTMVGRPGRGRRGVVLAALLTHRVGNSTGLEAHRTAGDAVLAVLCGAPFGAWGCDGEDCKLQISNCKFQNGGVCRSAVEDSVRCHPPYGMAPRWGSTEQARLVAGRRLVRFMMFAPDGAGVLSSGRKPRVGCGTMVGRPGRGRRGVVLAALLTRRVGNSTGLEAHRTASTSTSTSTS